MFEITTNRMKRSSLIIALALLGVAASFWQCGSDPAPAQDPKDAQLEKLSKTWNTTSQTIDGVPDPNHDNFSIAISGSAGQNTFNYTTTGRPACASPCSPWPASGTFTFEADFATTLKREDGTIITYSVTGSQLQMTFSYAGAGFTGRTAVVQGNWTFQFGL